MRNVVYSYMDALLASIDPGMPGHLPAYRGRYDGARSTVRFATLVGGPTPEIEQRSPGANIPFRRATTGRTQQQPSTGPTVITAATQIVDAQINGSGFMYGIDLFVQGTGGVNGAAVVAINEDAPWNAIDTVILRDVNGELVNLGGFDLRLFDLYGGWSRFDDTASTDANVFSAVDTGAAPATGNFAFHLFVPVGINRRTLLGIVGNQDRSQLYSLRSDIASSAAIYSTPPDTTLPSVTIQRIYDNYAVPAPTNAAGARQQQLPDKQGVLHYLTRAVNVAQPIGGTTVPHPLARLGNTIRQLILIFRAAGSRATAEANMPSKIQFYLGDIPIFTETVAYRRWLMFSRYGFDAPDGVLVYEFMTDMVGHAADELGHDYVFSNGLVNSRFECSYPAGFGAAASNSLTILTDDLVIPANVDIYA